MYEKALEYKINEQIINTKKNPTNLYWLFLQKTI